jgi:hypothetical protein
MLAWLESTAARKRSMLFSARWRSEVKRGKSGEPPGEKLKQRAPATCDEADSEQETEQMSAQQDNEALRAAMQCRDSANYHMNHVVHHPAGQAHTCKNSMGSSITMYDH